MNGDDRVVEPEISSIPKQRHKLLKWNGWGYSDTAFNIVLDNKGRPVLKLKGTRYPVSGLELASILDFFRKAIGMDFSKKTWPQPEIPSEKFPAPIMNDAFMKLLTQSKIDYSVDNNDRLFRAHGQTLHEVFVLRKGLFPRIPDCVVWPRNHEEVEQLVEMAVSCNAVIIPYGGGTGVSGALECPETEQRMIVSLDTSQMNQLLFLDEANLTACFQAGIVGQDLERTLESKGYTTGHEPDSYEFSSLGGWVATRASGMKKNSYGNIEDLLVDARMVTPKGTFQKNANQPRVSVGPDLRHVVLGSEGTFGVITEVTIKIRPVPAVRKYGCLVFPDFATGVSFMREVARQRCQPASVRLIDNLQFKSGQMLRPDPNLWHWAIDTLKKKYLTHIRGFDLDQICIVTLLFEGTEEDAKRQEKKLYDIGVSFGGIPAGEANGKQGYLLTFVIAYVRDFALDYNVLGESFETSIPWDKTLAVCENVKKTLQTTCAERGVKYSMVSCRVTQTYDTGACVYFYLAFNEDHIGSPLPSSTNDSHCISRALSLYEELEGIARDVILAHGGSLSHHHGVGKIRQKWLSQVLCPVEWGILRAIKQSVDPGNTFGNRNLVFNSHL